MLIAQCFLLGSCTHRVVKNGQWELQKTHASTWVPPLTDGESAGIATITVESLRDKQISQEHFLLIDSREPQAYEKEHIIGARNLPYSEVSRYSSYPEALQALQRVSSGFWQPSIPMILYCGGGDCPLSVRSARALIDFGFPLVVEMPEGLDGWKAKNLPTEPRK